MEAIVSFLMILLLSLVLYSRYRIFYKHKKALDLLPFVIFIADKQFQVQYKNKLAKQYIPDNVTYLHFDKIKSTNFIDNLCINEKKQIYMKSYVFWQDDKIYCIGIIRVCSCLVGDVKDLINNYALVGENLQMDISTLIQYTSKVLDSDWGCFYREINGECIEIAEYKSNHIQKILDKDCDKIKYFSPPYLLTRKYHILLRSEILDENIKNAWEEAGINHKILIPIIHDDSLYGIVSFAMFVPYVKDIDPGVIGLVSAILNFIIGIQVSIQNNLKDKENVQILQNMLVQYIKNKTEHSQNMYKKELEMYNTLSNCMSGAKEG